MPEPADAPNDGNDAASAAADAHTDVHVHSAGGDKTPPGGLDPATSNNLLAMLITQAQQDLHLNMAAARNLVANQGAMLTMGVQQINAACLVQLFRMSPAEAQALGLQPQPPPTS